ncbi:Phytanoyl-CoA dioxygenase [Trinorchestia longiramus]|nr:Phytanoyl-CoA dioxygenase [Trinorchestia longiramus]
MANYEPVLSAQKLKEFHRNGYAVVENFLTADEVSSVRAACDRLVEEMDVTQHPSTVFTTTCQTQSRSQYFLESGDKVRFFFEKDALDESGNLKVPKHLSLNKIGHALHWQVPEFRRISFADKIKSVAQSLRFVDPAVVQSMYIFKQPGYGGEVTPHKDSTFLATDPPSCVGLWFPLEDTTLDNGCLWFSPGSHQTPTTRRFVRCRDADGLLMTKFTAPPDADDPTKYVAVPVNKGSLVLIHGCVDHKSDRNTSDRSRHVYTFHIIEQHNTRWDANNWLQPTENMPFTSLYSN